MNLKWLIPLATGTICLIIGVIVFLVVRRKRQKASAVIRNLERNASPQQQQMYAGIRSHVQVGNPGVNLGPPGWSANSTSAPGPNPQCPTAHVPQVTQGYPGQAPSYPQLGNPGVSVPYSQHPTTAGAPRVEHGYPSQAQSYPQHPARAEKGYYM